jgi:hypothetical protein
MSEHEQTNEGSGIEQPGRRRQGSLRGFAVGAAILAAGGGGIAIGTQIAGSQGSNCFSANADVQQALTDMGKVSTESIDVYNRLERQSKPELLSVAGETNATNLGPVNPIGPNALDQSSGIPGDTALGMADGYLDSVAVSLNAAQTDANLSTLTGPSPDIVESAVVSANEQLVDAYTTSLSATSLLKDIVSQNPNLQSVTAPIQSVLGTLNNVNGEINDMGRLTDQAFQALGCRIPAPGTPAAIPSIASGSLLAYAGGISTDGNKVRADRSLPRATLPAIKPGTRVSSISR